MHRIPLALGRLLATCAALTLLGGCMGGITPPGMFGFGRGNAPADPAAMPSGQAQSQLIDGLRARHSILPPGGPYEQVARAVIDAASGASAAELRVARLRAEAKSKNWLPSIRPGVTLSSLGALAGSILLEQALFDHGRRKAERAHAAADVEVAAVFLAQDMNQRVYDGLVHYLTIARAQEQAAIAERASARLTEFESVVAMRVQGGLSDRSEEQIITQKRSEMMATLTADRNAAAQAQAELGAMTSRPLTGVRGLDRLPAPQPAEPLAVVKAVGEAARATAQAQMNRAGLLPGLGVTATGDGDGVTGGLRLGDTVIGFGTGAALRAADAEADAATRRIDEQRQNSARSIVKLEQDIAALLSREAQGAGVLRQTQGNLDLFVEQYRAGRRTLLELVQQYDAFARLDRDQAAIKYEVARLNLEIARDRGLLVDGDRM
ncbi:MAG: TolC family protein [Pseudomonadota bacterium]